MSHRPVRIADILRPAFQRRADAIALVDGAATATYRDLGARSDRIAAALRAAGLRDDDRVCILAPKSIDAIAAVLGVLGAGGVYVPLDCRSPAARLSSMIRSCAPCWIIADGGHALLLDACLQAAGRDRILGTFRLDAGLTTIGDVLPGRAVRGAAGDRGSPPGFGNLAYILFTSGSTGEPKGVPIPHQNVVDYVGWANAQFGVEARDRISSHAPLHFDMSVWDVFATLAAGAELHLVPPQDNLSPQALAGFIRGSALTQWYSVPSVLVTMAGWDAVRQGDFPQLRRVIWGGEALPVPALRYWMERLPHAVFTNVYGPTEATVNCAFHTLRSPPAEDATRVPIGIPLPGRQLSLRDEAGRAVAEGEVGFLHVGGAGLSPGYWRDPARTAASFHTLPDQPGLRWYRTGDLARQDAAGLYYFHGRADRQIKSRGYRIELDDVAAALWRVPGVEEGAVVAVPVGGLEGMRICAAYVPRPSGPRTPAEVKAALSQHLPAYMLPRRWLALDALPRNVSGKVDLRTLEDAFAGA